jgi:hypothetical protein
MSPSSLSIPHGLCVLMPRAGLARPKYFKLRHHPSWRKNCAALALAELAQIQESGCAGGEA